MHVLGIDAGGTKTICLLADGEGRILGEARGGRRGGGSPAGRRGGRFLDWTRRADGGRGGVRRTRARDAADVDDPRAPGSFDAKGGDSRDLLPRRAPPHDCRHHQRGAAGDGTARRSEEHTSELQSLRHLVCRLLLEKKNKYIQVSIASL